MDCYEQQDVWSKGKKKWFPELNVHHCKQNISYKLSPFDLKLLEYVHMYHIGEHNKVSIKILQHLNIKPLITVTRIQEIHSLKLHFICDQQRKTLYGLLNLVWNKF